MLLCDELVHREREASEAEEGRWEKYVGKHSN